MKFSAGRSTFATAAWFAGLFALFFRDMLFGGTGYFYGDYRQQFYPWAKLLHDHIRHFTLPLWTPDIGCGFPLLAEGQIAALYPLNWALGLLLPFPLSYHAGFLVLFALSAAFTVLFGRRSGLSAPAAAFAATVYLFGSAYAGLFYGVMTLRVLTWFPLALVFARRLAEGGGGKYPAVGLAVAWALLFLGGYPQMAVYGVLATLLYLAWAARPLSPARRKRLAGFVLFAALLGAGLSAAQTLPTLELARESVRSGMDASFALQKSFNPLNLATLVWPGFGIFLGFDLYIGIVPLLLAAVGAGLARRDRDAAFFLMAAALFALLGLGRFNPLYAALVRWAGFTFFRVPSKFLFFSCFFLALLAGKGLDHLLTGSRDAARRYLAVLRWGFFASMAVFAAAHVGARAGRGAVLAWAEGFVRRHIHGQPGHTRTLEEYLARVQTIFGSVIERTRWDDPQTFWPLAVWTVLLALAWALRGRFFGRRTLLIVCFTLTAADLYRYTEIGTGFRGNRVPSATVRLDAEAAFLAGRASRGRTYEAVFDPVTAVPRWLANSNLLFGWSSVGIYSPLAVSSYREATETLNAVNDATDRPATTPAAVIASAGRLGALGVRTVVSPRPLDDVSYSEAARFGSGDIVYENRAYKGRAFVARPVYIDEGRLVAYLLDQGGAPSGAVPARVISEGPLRLELAAAAGERGRSFLFVPDLHYPGWSVSVDGAPAPLYRADGAFRAVPLESGEHRIVMRYVPLWFYAGAVLSFLSVAAASLTLLARGRPPEPFGSPPRR